MSEKLRLLSLFSGCGAWEKALERLKIPFELVGYCEYDKYASKAYSAIHDTSESLNLGDITMVNEKELPECDMITYSSPCTSISVAGKQEGIILMCNDCNSEFRPETYAAICPKCNGSSIKSKTASGLLFDALRIIKQKKPKYALAENVKNLVGKKFKKDFDSLIEYLDMLGYNSYWKVLNAKDFNVAQSRERVFVVSVRKDIDDGSFNFPEPLEDNGVRLKDYLEDEVDEKYYINQEKADKLIQELTNKGKLETPDYSKTIRTSGRSSLDRHSWDVYPVALTEERTEEAKAQRKEYREKYGKDFSSRRGKELKPRPDEISNCITSTPTKEHYVLVPKSCSLRTRTYCGQPQQLEVRNDEFSNTITSVCKDSLLLTTDEKNKSSIMQIGMLDMRGNDQVRRVYDPKGLSPTLNTMQGGNREPKVIVCEERTDEGLRLFDGDYCGTIRTINAGGDKRVIEEHLVSDSPELKFIGAIGDKKRIADGKDLSRNYPSGNRVYDESGIACTQTAIGGGIGGHTGLYRIHYRIRKLSALECFRLMDFDDEDFHKAQKALNDAFYKGKDRSSSQLYKIAGNSVVVGVLEEIFRNLLVK